MSLHTTRRRGLAAAVVTGLVAAPLAFGLSSPAQAAPSTGLVISEVYGGGGNSGATFTNDFIELYNPTNTAISVGGMSVQYRSSDGASAQLTNLTGSVPAKGYYLVQEGAGTTVTDKPLPTPDATGTIAMSGSSGVVILASNTTAVTAKGNFAGTGNPANVIDTVGFGGAATTFETTNTVTNLSSTTSAQRAASGADTDNNDADFTEAVPTPKAAPAGGGTTPTDPGEPVTIAAIQGTDVATSPMAGKTVTTEGVVTAAYPTGGFQGLYIQTGGTGGATDATPGASDAIFVYGSSAIASGAEIGDSVQVTGPVSEFNGTTEITPAAGGVTELTTALAPVTPAAIAYPATEAGREAHEGELLAPTGDFTVSNVYNIDGGASAFAEIGLAAGNKPLQQPTDLVDAQTGDTDAIVADNAARGVALDDGASLNLMTAANQSLPLPWVTNNPNPPRVGAPVTFTAPVILEFRNSVWKFQPTSRITDNGAGTATFGNDRAANARPADVGGDLKLSTFNVLNYFPTTGEAHVAKGGTCSYYLDREGNKIADNTCNPDGPRGAATDASLARQQVKIVNAINKLGADVVSLEEIENSVKMIGQTDRDNAVRTLVTALNAAAGGTTPRWAFAPSPAAADLPALGEQDVIRTAFIYNPSTIDLVGASDVLVGSAAFGNAREPLAQAFKAKGAPASEAFGVIVNHFKSKGSGTADPDGQGNANADRVAQANALVDFADDFTADRDIDALYLAGDFNSYTQEDPMQVLYQAGYTNITSDDATDASYSFDGLAGSLDHVLGNQAATDQVTGSDIWEINANESLAYQYSRYNYHGAITFDGTDPFAASDHNPELIGITTDPSLKVQILATNDFHGRIQRNGAEAGAAVLAGAVKQLRAANPNTIFAAAGDLIGASTFESFIAQDKPTIDALNEAGLEVSAVGNHEFDKGYDDLVNRVIAPYDAEDNPYGGAEWKYLGANVKLKESGDPALDGTWLKEEPNGVQVGFIGAVTEHLPELVSPGGIEDIEVTDIVEATNEAADDLEAQGADVVVLLVHEGAAGTDCATMDDDPTSDFGSIIAGVNENVDAIVSGHTHLSYNCSFPVKEWEDEGRAVTERPVVSAGQYGYNLNKLVFSVDPETGDVTNKTQDILPLTGPDPDGSGPMVGDALYPVDPATKTIVDKAVADADVLGAKPLGEIGGVFNRAKLADGTTENRGGESTLGNLVAEIQRSATSSETAGAAQIAFMNPGGLRADLAGTGPGDYPRTVTFKQAATVQPFANTLVNEDLTGAQIKEALEQQWQPAGASRPFLKLGISDGFTYSYDPDAAQGERIIAMFLDGEPIDPAATYSVTVNSFLSTGGDNFTALGQGTGKQDTGVTDLQAQVDYFAELASDAPLPVDYSQRAVGVDFPADAPEVYAAGDTVSFNVSSFSMTGPGDVTDDSVEVSLGDEMLGSVPVVTTVQTALPGYDEAGTATVSVDLPDDVVDGPAELVLTGEKTGTSVTVPIEVEAGDGDVSPSTVTAAVKPAKVTVGQDVSYFGAVVVGGPNTPTGTVELYYSDIKIGEATLSPSGVAIVPVGPWPTVGRFPVDVRYLGDDFNAPSQATVNVNVVKQTPKVRVDAPNKVKKGATPKVDIEVLAEGVKANGKVRLTYSGKKPQTVTLRNGSASPRLKPLNSTGKVTLEVKYLGSNNLVRNTKTVTIRVTK